MIKAGPCLAADAARLHLNHHAAAVVDYRGEPRNLAMTNFLIWLLLAIFCWPLALLALILYPLVWLIALPFRLLGFALEGVFAFLRALLLLPARLLRGRAAV